MDDAAGDLNIDNICRVCLQAEDSELDRVLINIFSEERGFSIVESLLQICSIQVSKNDELPQLICSVCLPRLRNAFFLRRLSQRSQQTLDNSRRPPKAAKPSEDTPPFEYIEFSEMLSDIKSENEDTVPCVEESAALRCCGCEEEEAEEFDSEKALRRHSVQVHCPKEPDILLSGKIRCSVCYVVFEGEDEERGHREKYPNVRTLRGCSYCRCNFYSEDTLEAHIGQFHKDRLYKCCGCEFRSDNQIDLATHTLFHKHSARKENHKEEGGFQCAVCYARFETLRKRQCHERLPYQKVDTVPVAMNQPEKVPAPPESKRARIASPSCDKCSASFPNMNALESHVCIIFYECNKCPKKFISKKTFKTHKCLKSPRKPDGPDGKQFQCSLCYQYFRHLFQLRKHEQTHAPNRNFPCRYCSATFLRAAGRDNHEVRHTGEARYTCEVCGKVSNKRQSYVQHYEAIHGTAAGRVHACNLCEQRFSKDHFLANHLTYVHHVRPADDGWKDKFRRKKTDGVALHHELGGRIEDFCYISRRPKARKSS